MFRLGTASWPGNRRWVALGAALLVIVGAAALASHTPLAQAAVTGPAPNGCDQTLDARPRNFEAPASSDPFQQYCTPSVQRNDTPADPGYDQSEPDTQNAAPPDTNLYDERFDLFGFPSARSMDSAKYADPGDQGEVTPAGADGISRLGKPQVAGFNAAGAWKLTRGEASVSVAILDTGIRWDQEGLRRQVRLNTGELPYPEVDPAMAVSLDSSNPSLACATMPHGPTRSADGAFTATTYDVFGQGAAEVDDYACDPRVAAVISAGYPGRIAPKGRTGQTLITGQDLLHTFGHCRIDAATHAIVPAGGTASGAPGCPDRQSIDNDHNGYANDLVGWNFFDNNNDPTDLSSYFQAGNHGSGRANDAVERANDGEGELGVCPHCQFMPIRVWDTFVSDANTFGMGMVYATDNGVKVIEGADGNLYHSSFTEAASNYAYRHGVVQTYSGDDLNTGDHNYPGNYSHAMLIQGTVPDSIGLGQSYSIPSPPSGTPAPVAGVLSAIRDQFLALQNQLGAAGFGSEVPPTTFFRGANTTQYGGHSSLSLEGTTGSQNTGKASGAAALVVSAAREHGIALSPDETREILEQTAERATSPNGGALGSPDLMAPPTCPGGATPQSSQGTCATPDLQWTEHFGWGRVDLGAAVAVAVSGKIPPIAAIDSPDWFAPLTGSSVKISGQAAAPHATGGKFTWKLMWAPGVQPAPNAWQTVSSGTAGSGTVSDFGSIDLAKVRAALASYTQPVDLGGPVFSPTAPNPYEDQFTVQLEVNGQDIPITGIDRRVFTALNDPTLSAGFPKRMCQADLGKCGPTTPASGGEAPIRYADLTGSNQQELIVPSEDGFIHAYRPGGGELSGWPVRTQVQQAAFGHQASPALRSIGRPHEPPRAAVVADLSDTGHPDVITAAGVHVYAWQGNGRPVPGFPVAEDLSHCGPALESQALQERPKCGFLASPAVGYLEGRGKGLDIIVPSLDGYLYAWDAHGRPLPNFPVRLHDPHSVPKTEIAESINDPAVGNLTGARDGHADVVVATNEYYGPSSSGGGDVSFYGSLSAAAGGSTRVYAVDGESGKYLSGWPVAIPGIIQNVLPLVGPGNDPSIVSINGSEQVVTSATGGALSVIAPNGTTTRTIQQQSYGPHSNATDRSGGLNLFEGAVEGNLLGTPGSVDVVKYELGLADAANLLLVGQNVPYNHLIGAWDGSTGLALNGYPTITDDYQFLSSSEVAKLAPGQSNQVLAGTGLGLLHAYDGSTGQDVSGFPKVTGGWLFAPAALSTTGEVADITREGYLFQWKVGQPPCQPTGTEWPSFRHDPMDSGNFDNDGTPPASPGRVSLRGAGGSSYALKFVTPGDDGFCGNADHYLVELDGRSVPPSSVGLGKPAAGGSVATVKVSLLASVRRLGFQAVDAAGNVGAPVSVAVPGRGGRGAGGRRPRPKGPTPSCPLATGSVHGQTLGPLRLGMSRTSARKLLKKLSTRKTRYMDFFCLTPTGIRAGYASAQLLRGLPRGERSRLVNTIVEILTANRSYAIRGVGVGTRLRRVARRLGVGRGYAIGLNTWYLFNDGTSRGVFKVRHGVIEEIGIAENALTSGRRQAVGFLKSFS